MPSGAPTLCLYSSCLRGCSCRSSVKRKCTLERGFVHQGLGVCLSAACCDSDSLLSQAKRSCQSRPRCGGTGGSGEVVHHEAWMLGMLCYSQRNGKRSLSWASAKQKFSRLNFKDKASLKQSLNTRCMKLPLTEGLRELKHTPSTYNLDKGFHLEAKRTNLWHVGDFDSHSGKHTNLFFF